MAQAEAARCRRQDEAQRATVAAAEARSRDVVREAQEKLAAVEECVRDSRAERDAAVNAAQEERDAAVAAAQEERDEAVEEARRERDAAVAKARAELEDLSDEAAEHHDRGAKALMRCAELDVALRESDAQRRQLHDALQTIKGGVRVCARPPSPAPAPSAPTVSMVLLCPRRRGRRSTGAPRPASSRGACASTASSVPRRNSARFTPRWMPWSDRHLMATTSACWLTVRRGRARPIRCLVMKASYLPPRRRSPPPLGTGSGGVGVYESELRP